MSILDNEGHDPNGLGNRPSWSEVNQLRARVAELEDPHFLKGLQARVDKAESRVNLLEVTEDMYRTVAMRHEARVAELVVLLREALDSRAPDYVDAVYSNWSKLARAAVLNAPANAELPEGVTQEDLDAAIPLPPLGDSRRPAQSPAGALTEALRKLVDKLGAIEADSSFQGIWPYLYAHGYTYSGPDWREALWDARATLAALDAGEPAPRPAQSPAGAEAMREAILQALPGGTHCDPQEIADMIRAIPVLAGAVTDEMVERAAQSPAGAKHCPYCLSTEVILDEGRNFCRDCLERFGCW